LIDQLFGGFFDSASQGVIYEGESAIGQKSADEFAFGSQNGLLFPDALLEDAYCPHEAAGLFFKLPNTSFQFIAGGLDFGAILFES
jgi:hypothetical protein